MQALTSINLIALLSFAGIASFLGAIIFAVRDMLYPRTAVAAERELQRLPSFRDEAPGLTARLDLWIERTLYWAALGISPQVASMLVLLVVVTVAGALYVATENEMFTATGGLMALVGVLMVGEVRKRLRLRKFEEQFPMALELLARAVRAGESLDQALLMVGDAMPVPAGMEFTRCAKQLELGLALNACMRALSRRTGLIDVRIFTTAVSVHREAGGNLPVTLDRLADVIRDRMAYHRQLKSMTASGRFSTMLTLVLGPLLFAYMFIFQPQYGNQLLTDPLGRLMLAWAVVSELIGLVIVLRMIKADY